MTMTTTWTKLRSGEWGIRVAGQSVAVGDQVAVTKRSGETQIVQVGAVLWTGDGVSLCGISQSSRGGYGRSPQRGGSGYRGAWTGCSCGSREDQPRDSDCASCRHDSE